MTLTETGEAFDHLFSEDYWKDYVAYLLPFLLTLIPLGLLLRWQYGWIVFLFPLAWIVAPVIQILWRQRLLRLEHKWMSSSEIVRLYWPSLWVSFSFSMYSILWFALVVPIFWLIIQSLTGFGNGISLLLALLLSVIIYHILTLFFLGLKAIPERLAPVSILLVICVCYL